MTAPSGSRRVAKLGYAALKEFVALGIAIAQAPLVRLSDMLTAQPEVRLIRIADEDAGECRYRVEVTLPTRREASEAITVWRHIKQMLFAQLGTEFGEIRIVET
ncbi:MAG: hypothetical protein ABI846_03140 [Rudaea sp.]